MPRRTGSTLFSGFESESVSDSDSESESEPDCDPEAEPVGRSERRRLLLSGRGLEVPKRFLEVETDTDKEPVEAVVGEHISPIWADLPISPHMDFSLGITEHRRPRLPILQQWAQRRRVPALLPPHLSSSAHRIPLPPFSPPPLADPPATKRSGVGTGRLSAVRHIDIEAHGVFPPPTTCHARRLRSRLGDPVGAHNPHLVDLPALEIPGGSSWPPLLEASMPHPYFRRCMGSFMRRTTEGGGAMNGRLVRLEESRPADPGAAANECRRWECVGGDRRSVFAFLWT
ncbi:hypothetical protein C8J57DRAFT_1706312 [Mycena rebaudengoi]|nr:hypothetical protein C8J57DRAFT_1706312 [Mycena rebaudengoi]